MTKLDYIATAVYTIIIAIALWGLTPTLDQDITLTPEVQNAPTTLAASINKTAGPEVRRLHLSASDREALIKNLYWEARGEPTSGVLKAAQVVLNRSLASRWPDSVEGVIRQDYQFSWTLRVKWNRPMEDTRARDRIKRIVQHLEARGWTQQQGLWLRHYVRKDHQWKHYDELPQGPRDGNHQFFG